MNIKTICILQQTLVLVLNWANPIVKAGVTFIGINQTATKTQVSAD